MTEERDIEEEEKDEESDSADDNKEGQQNDTHQEDLIKQKDEEIKRLQKALEVQKEKELNFSKLDKKAKKSEEEKTQIEERLKKLEEERDNEKTLLKESLNSKKTALIEKLSRGDKDLADKIEFFYGRLNVDDLSESDIIEKLDDAYTLATRGKASAEVNPLSRIMGAGGNSGFSKSYNTSDDDFSKTDAGKKLASDLGLRYINKQDK